MNQKGFANIILVVVVVVILVGTVGYFAFVKKSEPIVDQPTPTPVAIQTKTPDAVLSDGVTVISPNGGEQWVVGKDYVIKWSSKNVPEKAAIGIQLANPDLDENGEWIGVANDLKNTGSYAWKIPPNLSGNYKIYIYTQGIGKRIGDTSDGSFKLTK